jgi:hypothetical protein
MNEILKKELEKNPLRFYDTILFLSAEAGNGHKQDFVIMGDRELITKHFAAMLMRHESFYEMVTSAILLSHIAKEKNK